MNDEPARQFVDTNILVYAHDTSAEAKHQRAKALIQDLWERQAGCLSVQVLQELYVTLTGKVARPPPVKSELLADKEVRRTLSPREIEGIWSVKHHLKHVDTIFRRVFR